MTGEGHVLTRGGGQQQQANRPEEQQEKGRKKTVGQAIYLHSTLPTSSNAADSIRGNNSNPGREQYTARKHSHRNGAGSLAGQKGLRALPALKTMHQAATD